MPLKNSQTSYRVHLGEFDCENPGEDAPRGCQRIPCGRSLKQDFGPTRARSLGPVGFWAQGLLYDGCSKLLHGKTTILREKQFVFRGPIADFRGAYFTPVLVSAQTVLTQNFAKA